MICVYDVEKRNPVWDTHMMFLMIKTEICGTIGHAMLAVTMREKIRVFSRALRATLRYST